MSYLMKMTEIIADTKNSEQERFIYDMHEMVLQMIKEIVPQIVKEEMLKETQEIKTNIRTMVNGKNIELNDIKNAIQSEIEKSLKK